MEEQSKFESIAASLTEEFVYGSANRLQAVAMLRNLRWNRSMEAIAAFGHDVLRLVALAYPDFTDAASTVIDREVFLDGLHPSTQVLELEARNCVRNCYGFGVRSQTVTVS